MSKRCVWIFAAVSLLLAFAGAQTPDTATIQGKVVDSSGAAVAGAQITVVNSIAKEPRTVTSDSGGNYSIPGLPILGTYDLSATKAGFATATSNAISLVGGATAAVNLTLNVSANQSSVTVTGTVGQVQADEPQLGDLLTAAQIMQTPLYDNQITYLPLLNSANRPAINMGDQFMDEDLITTNGGGRRETAYVVDGAEANDDWGRQTIFSTMPAPTVQEMTVLEDAFSAEYGWTTGGVVNIVSNSGSNQFHGQLYDTVRPQGTEALLSNFTLGNASSGNDIAYDKMNQIGWDVSGPIGAHTQFFVGGEYTKRERGSPITSPLEPEDFEGVYGDGLGFFRLDHQFSSNNNLFFRADVDRYYDTNPLIGAVGGNTLPSAQRVFRRYTYTGDLGDTWVITPNIVNNLHLQWQLADPITEFSPVNNTTELSVQLTSTLATGSPTFTEGTSSSAKLINHQYNPNDTVTIVHGNHQIMFGADGVYGSDGGNSKESGGPLYLGEFTFAPCSGPTILYCETTYISNIANATTFTQSFGNANYRVSDSIFDAFVRDDYHVTRSLTVDLGLRYDRQTFTDASKDWAPRLGFAWDLGGKGTTVLRGGYGIFYSQLPDNMEANYAIQDPSSGVFTFSATPGKPGFPTSLTPWPSEAAMLAAGGTASVPSSIYIRPGRAAYYNQFFPTTALNFYPDQLLNPYTESYSLGLQHRFGNNWVLSVDFVGQHTLDINRPLDLNAPPPFVRTAQNQWRGVNAANNVCADSSVTTTTTFTAAQDQSCATDVANDERPLTIYDKANSLPVNYYSVIADVNDGFSFYDALETNLSHRFTRNLSMLASYTWSHAIDNVDQDATAQSPNLPNYTGDIEKGNALWNQPNRIVLSGTYVLPLQIDTGGVLTLASGLPYNITTGTTNGGDSGGETDRPVINGVVIGRNTGVGTPIYSLDPYVQRSFRLSERLALVLNVNALNVLNHANFVSFNGTYGNGTTQSASFATPSAGITAQLPARELQFSARLTF